MKHIPDPLYEALVEFLEEKAMPTYDYSGRSHRPSSAMKLLADLRRDATDNHQEDLIDRIFSAYGITDYPMNRKMLRELLWGAADGQAKGELVRHCSCGYPTSPCARTQTDCVRGLS